ncbi:hypothetical protein D1872_312020 [compost metagenome]
MGKMWRNRIVRSFTPMARLASTYSFSRSDTVCPYISLANSGMPTTPTAIIALVKPLPMDAAIAIDRTKDGNASSTSISRIMMFPIRPP